MTYLPRPTETANQNAKISILGWRAPKLPTEAEIRATEDDLDRAYQKKLCQRVHDFVQGVDRAAVTVRPRHRRSA